MVPLLFIMFVLNHIMLFSEFYNIDILPDPISDEEIPLMLWGEVISFEPYEIIFEDESGEVLILAYANEEALRETLRRKEAVFFSTSRNEIWHKGATSGDTLSLVEVQVNCEQNSLLYLVRPQGQGACHTKNDDGTARSSCYYRSIDTDTDLRFI